MRGLWAAGLLLRRLRAELAMLLLLFVVIAATSFLAAAAPRLLNGAADDGLRYAMLRATPAQRNVVVADVDKLRPGDGGLSVVRAVGDQLAARFPPTLASLIADRSLRITSVRLSVTDPPSYETSLALRYQDGLTQAARLVAGRWPVSRGVGLPPAQWVDPFGAPDTGPTPTPVSIEAALSTAAAADIGVQVGDRLAVKLDPSDPLLARVNMKIAPTEVDVVGLFDPADAGSAYWVADGSLLRVVQVGTETHPAAQAIAYISAGTYTDVWTISLPFRYEWGFQIDPQRLDAGQVPQLQLDLRHLDLVTGAPGLGEDVVLRNGLVPLVDAFATQLVRSETILSLAAIGPVGLAVGVLGMIAILLVTRRRAALGLARGRGASGVLLLGTELWEATLLAGSASLVGLLAAVAAIPARASPLSPVLAVAVGAADVALLLVATWPTARRPLGQLVRDDARGRRLAPRRVVLEMTVVGIAAAGALMARDRGLSVAGDGGVATFNPLLGAVPLLCGLAAGLVALRLYPLPVRGLGWLAARRRDLVPVLGLRTVGRHPAAANLALLVLLLTAAFAAFSSVVVSSVNRGQVVTSYVTVGADFRVERVGVGALDPSLKAAAIPGVAAVAPGIVDPSAVFTSTPSQRTSIYLAAIDTRADEQVVAGLPADPGWPTALLGEPTGIGVGTDQNPIPAIASAQLPPGSAGLAPGATFHVAVLGRPMTFRVVERRASFPGIGPQATFVVAPMGWVQAAFGSPAQPPTTLWLRASADAVRPLTAAIAASGGSAHLVSRYDAYAALHDAPLGAAVTTGFALALVIAAAYMALAIIGAVVLSAARRNQDLAYLRTLGVTGRQALALTLIEHAPPVLLALAPGVVLGIGVALLLEPGLGLAAFVGAGGIPLFIDVTALAAIVVALVGVVAVAVAAGTWLSLRARLVDALRIGEH